MAANNVLRIHSDRDFFPACTISCIMKKYLWIPFAVAVITAVVLMARYDKNYDTGSHGYDIKCAQPSEPTSASASLACTINPKQDTDQSQSGPPWWHKLVAWPEGITAWLLVLTLGAIIWQAWETRKAAQGAKDGAAAAMAQIQFMKDKERARIEITFAEDSDAITIRPDEMVIIGTFHLNLKNVGGTAARNITGWYDAFASEEEKAPKTEDRFFLAPPATVEGNSWEPIPAPLTIDPRFTADRAPELFYVYLRGEVTYNDIFEKEPNSTRFLLRRQFIRSGIGKAISREFWTAAGNGENEST